MYWLKIHCMYSTPCVTYNQWITGSVLKEISEMLFTLLFVDVWMTTRVLNRRPLPSARFSEHEATVYGKHGRRRGLAFSMVVVHTAMAMGSQFVWNSNTSLVVCWWLTSAGWRQTALAPAAVSVNCMGSGWAGGSYCQWIQLTASQPPFSTLPARPWKGPRPGAKAREEENHFQQNKPALSISTL